MFLRRSIFCKVLFFILLWGGGLFAQTNPAPFNLGGGNYIFPNPSWPNSSPSGTYPLNSIWHRCGILNPTLSDPTTLDYTSVYLTSLTNSRIVGLAVNGFNFQNRVLDGDLGAFVVGLNSTGRTNVNVAFSAQSLSTGSPYNLRLQYRVSTASAWQDVPGPVEYLSLGAISPAVAFSVNISVLTANAVDNLADFQVRWKYYYTSGSGSSSPIRLYGITISSTPLSGDYISTGSISGSPFCVTPTLSTTINVPFTYTPSANFPAGTCTFTAELSNASGIFTTPTVIGTIISNASGAQTITASLPANTGTGTAYRIRVVSNAPPVNGSNNGVDLTIRLSPSDVTSAAANASNVSATISWLLPSPCYSEIMVVANAGGPVPGAPSGNGSAYTPNATFGSGTAFGTGFVVYKSTGSNVTVTNLVNGTVYYFKIWVRYGNEWTGGQEVFCTPGAGTLLTRGDFMVVGVNANNTACSGVNSEDVISFICFKDINNGTILDLTDNGWERAVVNRWGNTEGTLRCTRTGVTIPKGTVITFTVTMAGVGAAVTPDAGWTFANLNPGGTFNLNSGGDQFFFMQGGNWIPGTAGSQNAIYTGTVLFGFNTKSVWNRLVNNSQDSGPYPFLECYSVFPAIGTDFIKFTGSLAPKTQRNWVDSINDVTKWTKYTTCALFNAATPQYHLNPAIVFPIIPGGYQRGKWIGTKNTNWFACDNWEDFVIPDSLTDVWIPPVGVVNDCYLQLDSNHYCRDMLIQGYRLYGADTNTKVLRIYGNLNITGGVFDFNDANPNTKDGLVYLKGNWTNYSEPAFREGNSKVIFNGTGVQSINTPVKEVFWWMDMDNTAGLNSGTNINVDKQLTFINGIISTSSNELYTTNPLTTSISGYGLTKYLNGNLRRQIAASGVYDFPVGTLSDYELASVNLTSQTGINNLVGTFVSPTTGAAPNPGLCLINGSAINGMLDAGNWTITPNPVPTAINYSLTLNERGMTNSVIPATRYGIIRRDDATTNWLGTGVGTHSNGTQVEVGGTATAVRNPITDLTSFGDFGIGFGSSPLPVEWLSFNAWPAGSEVKLLWQTASERFNDYFLIERSVDGRNFEVIGRKEGSGNSTAIQTYNSDDLKPFIGLNYYRIRQVDFDGKFEYSVTIAVRFSASHGVSTLLYPNPVKGDAWLIFNAMESGVKKMQVYDLSGRMISEQSFTVEEGVNTLSIDFTDLPKGIYFLFFDTEKLKVIRD
ncbi:hypothetical protein BH11BAC2_BH11BAC2_14680 [soil metagenome]